MQMARGFMGNPSFRAILVFRDRRLLFLSVETIIIYFSLPDIKRSPWPKRKTTGEQDDARSPVQ
jgi:hypothetical protein